MRLEVKRSSKLTKTEKQKKINKEKKSKGPKLNPLYNDNSYYDGHNVDMSLTKLRYGMITCCNCTYFTVGGDDIIIKNSWEEIILIMLDNLITNYPTNYIDKLIEFDVTSQNLSVDTRFGKYSFDKNFKAYKIFDKDVYLESTFSVQDMFKAIVGLTKALNIRLDEITFHLMNNDYKNERLNFSDIESRSLIVTTDKLLETLDAKGTHLVSMSIFDIKTEVHRIEAVLVIFCNTIYSMLEDDDTMLLLGGTESTGVCLNDDVGDRQSMRIKDSGISIYTDLDTEGIVDFIERSIYKLQLDNNDIKYKFEVLDLKTSKKEWEIE